MTPFIAAVRGDTATIGASKDASIFQNNVNNSSGGGNALIAGTNAQSSPRRALIAFDVAGNVPAGATIDNVQLNLVLGATAGGGGGGGGGENATIELHPVQADWGEGVAQTQSPPSDSLGGQGQGVAANAGDVTWAARMFSGTPWTTAGGDFAPSSASAVVGTTLNSTNSWLSTASLVSDVQGWLDNPATNFGWILVNADETSANTSRTFFSSEVATATFRPQLVVEFTPIPEPGGAILALAWAAVWFATRVKREAGRLSCRL
jgi:hypothetical protein